MMEDVSGKDGRCLLCSGSGNWTHEPGTQRALWDVVGKRDWGDGTWPHGVECLGFGVKPRAHGEQLFDEGCDTIQCMF